MDTSGDIREFLTARRARLTPTDVGLPDFGGRRRVPGLRREEVSLLAGISVEYYVRLERGNATGISDSVLDGISRALQLDQAEHDHLRHLMHAASQAASIPRRRLAPRAKSVSPGTQRLLDAMTEVPAIIQNSRMDIVAANALGRALFSQMFLQERGPVNFARFLFLDPHGRSAYREWDDSAEQIVALLRAASARTPWDAELRELIEELAGKSPEFRELWGTHDVRIHVAGTKLFRHPDVGDLDLFYEAMQLPSDPGLQFVGFTAEPGSTSDDALRLLGSLSVPAAAGRREV
jgi:transcriptional regulator with XRE-family HTH domain